MNVKLNHVFVLGVALSCNAQSIELENFDFAAESQKKSLSQKQQTFLTTPKNKSLNQGGRVSHYDPALGRQTFIWAPENQAAQNTLSTFGTQSSAFVKRDDVSMAKTYLEEYFPRKKKAQTLGTQTVGILSTAASSGDEVYAVSNHASKFGPVVVKFRQKYDGIDVFAREANILMGKEQNLVAVSGYLANAEPVKSSSSFYKKASGAANAIAIAYADMGVDATLSPIDTSSRLSANTSYTHYNASAKNDTYKVIGTPRGKKVWYEFEGKLLSAYYVEVAVKEKKPQGEEYRYAYVVSDQAVGRSSTQILFRKNQIARETFHYRTFADAESNTPFRGPMKSIYPIVGLTPAEAQEQVSLDYVADSHQLISLESGPISTNDPWLADSATMTSGNNVDAYADIAPRNGFSEGDIRAETSASNTFDWTYDPLNPSSIESTKASVVNLFYMNNWLHDYFYDFGFDEASGNAQNNNYGRGGIGGDAILAEGQDYGGIFNANMFTPADGQSPVMQMYLFGGFHERGVSFDITASAGDVDFSLNSAGLAFVGPESYETLEGKLVMVEEICAEPSNLTEVAGNIALVKESSRQGPQNVQLCNAAQSVKFAQDAGAIAVIAVGSDDRFRPQIYVVNSGVSVPSMGINGAEGGKLFDALAKDDNITVSMYRDYRANRDGTLANGIVAHEWGHYITNRLIGDGAGLNNGQGRGMGEGWGDFLAIYFAIKEEHRNIPGNENFQGLYSSGGWADPSTYYGIRRVPYSTDMNYNAVLFEHISDATPFEFDHPIARTGTNSQIHNQGEFWANTLLEVYVSLLNDSQRLSFKEAKERMAYYLVAGLKLTPISPTYTEARDGILAAAYAADRNDYNRMVAAFAKRGLGLKAVAPARFSTDNIGTVNSFAIESSEFTIVSSRVELEKTYSDLNLAEHSDPTLSSLSFLDDEKFQCPKDGVLDIFEFGEVVVELRNIGNLVLEDVAAKISSDAGHGIYFAHQGRVNVETMNPYSNSVEIRVPFVLFNATTAQEYSINMDFTHSNPETDYAKPDSIDLTVHYDYVPDEGRRFDDLENALLSQNDWTVNVDQPTAGSSNHQALLDSGFFLDGGELNDIFGTGQMWRALDNDFISDISLISPALKISATEAFSVSFEHAHLFELGNWDGSVLEVSIEGGAWTDVKEAGASIAGYDYNGVIRVNPDQPLTGREGFVNANRNLNETTVNFDMQLAGKSAQFRFRIGSDAFSGAAGWIIDNIGFQGIDNSPFSKIGPNKQWCYW